MKNNKGITLVSLTVTIILIIILAGTVTYSGIHVYENMSVEKFSAEMKIIQDKVNLICDKYKVSGKSDLETYLEDKEIKSAETIFDVNEMELRTDVVNLLENADDYLYFNKDLLDSKLGIKNLDQEVFINFKTREVISLKGVRYNWNSYYRQYDLPKPYGDENIEYLAETSGLEFSIIKEIQGLSATLKIDITQTDSNISKLYYGEEVTDNNKTLVLHWNEINKSDSEAYIVNIVKTGNYRIKAESNDGKSQEKSINVTLVNPPVLSSELIPIKFNEIENKWFVTSETTGTWYDYKSTDSEFEENTSKWANAMLSDGNYKKVNGKIKYFNPETGEEEDLNENNIKIKDSDLGSIFVWIPRYMYKIDSGCNTSTAGNIDIKFLKGTTDIPTDNTAIKVASEPGNGNWLVHPAFKNGAENYYSNGEWDGELTGIWVAKFKTNKDNEDKYSIQADVSPETNPVFSDVFIWAKRYNRDNQSHLLKNSEYGAVTYLAYSKYGTNKREIVINESENIDKKTGFNYKEKFDSSTTGNIYGIYDLNSVIPEYTSAIINTSVINDTGILQETSDLKRSSKYITIYENTIDKNKYGDAISEMCNTQGDASEGYSNWNENPLVSKYPNAENPIITRPIGTKCWFAYNNAKYLTTGTSETQNIGYRIVLIVE